MATLEKDGRELVRDVSPNYSIVIGNSAEDSYKKQLYVIFNKNTGVDEAEVTVLSKAISIARVLEQSLRAIEEADDLILHDDMGMATKIPDGLLN